MVRVGVFETVTATAGIAASAYWLSQRNRNKNGNVNTETATSEEDLMIKDLLPFETSDLMMQNVTSISAMTWYNGDIEKVRSPLRKRIRLILEANPWLCGRLRKIKKQGDKRRIALVYYPDTEKLVSEEIDAIFKFLDVESNTKYPLTRNLDYEKLPKILGDTLVDNSNKLIDKIDESGILFKISLIADYKNPTKKFALVMSMAHCIGDGQTFYNLHNMLGIKDEKDLIVKLNPHRKFDMPEKMEICLGGKEHASAMTNPPAGFVTRFLSGLLSSQLLGAKTTVKMFTLNEEWIALETQRAKDSGCDFVSTNDIVVSSLFQSIDCDQGIMAVDFRGKIDNCLKSDAGCYFNFLIFRPDDFKSPISIREAVNELKNDGKRKPKTKPMTSFEWLNSSKLFGTCSNWSTFCSEINMGDDVEIDIHYPVVPTDPLSVPARFVSGAYIFRHNKSSQPALLFVGTPKILTKLNARGMIGKELK